jgi:hypothetical protein
VLNIHHLGLQENSKKLRPSLGSPRVRVPECEPFPELTEAISAFVMRACCLRGSAQEPTSISVSIPQFAIKTTISAKSYKNAADYLGRGETMRHRTKSQKASAGDDFPTA